ncbi:L,D-transpeptidase family protein [Bosea lathyri]|uniref:Lipoprotein-anchoring transpeptidase ErfK/SrfK n=1 Tax=Bosea lathyri TaxID=1036778 RepID=A0A1H6CW58_9HYPH|nr:L,D-transpeptidase [Bosea lathyri]SEG76616.1 Lipoprotein-anchoring transpeptidase ErfK/SrfK [Bosea lathyri]
MKTTYLRMTILGLVFGLGASAALALTADQVNAVGFVDRQVVDRDTQSKAGPDPFIVKAQVLLSRRSISPGVIDGVDGENFRKAVAQFRRQERLGEGDEIDEATWLGLGGETVNDVIVEYRLSDKDVSYDFADTIPRDYAKQAKMKRLSYTSPQEMLGERFHMSEKLLNTLNPGERFSEAGTGIFVVSSRRSLEKGSARRIDAVKSTGMVVVFGAEDKILASYPATIGSEDNPSPTGEYTVERVARNPNYTYDPEKNFQQGKNTETLVLPPGPNGPVGTVWIALSKPTFGIHGTPEPSKVSKTTSHGCVRLTNWDAEELADLVKPGVPVRFVD